MLKKIIATLVLAFTFSFVTVASNAADNSTTSNAVTSFYGEYVKKTDNTESPAINQNHTGKPNSNKGNKTHAKEYPSHTGNGSTSTVHNKKEKVLPQTGDRSKRSSQLSGVSLLLALCIVIVYIKQKGE